MAYHSGIIKKVKDIYRSADYQTVSNYIKGKRATTEIMSITIQPQDYQKLALMRDKALARKKLLKGDDSYVLVDVTYNDKTVKADLRLKGGAIDHISGDKWSMRIKVRGDETVLGMSRFSIQDPKVCGYMNEWLLHRLYQYEGLIFLRYKFIRVIINGVNKGIYVLEESFSHELIANNKRKEGPILKFDETHLHDGSRFNPAIAKSETDIFFASNIDVFRTKTTFLDKTLTENYRMGRQLLEDFRAGRSSPSAVFDLELLARLYALINLTDSDHAVRWKNIRFYYNPVIGKLEPIGYNAYTSSSPRGSGLGKRKSIMLYDDYPFKLFVNEYHNLIFADREFFKQYIAALERISSTAYLDRFFNHIEEDLQNNLSIVYQDYPNLVFYKGDYYRNQQLIKLILNPKVKVPVKAFKVRGGDDNNKIDVAVANTLFLPIELNAVKAADTGIIFPLIPDVLSGKKASRPLSYTIARLVFDQDYQAAVSDDDRLILSYRILGKKELLSAKINTMPVPLGNITFLNQKTFADHECLSIDEQKKEITIQSGKWSLNDNLVIPKGYTVYCRGSVTLNFLNSAKLVSYSPIEFTGNKASPILIHSTDSTGQGIAVIDAWGKSILEHVTIEGVHAPSQGFWKLTGAVTFYESAVDMTHCEFKHVRAKNALHIIRSPFRISETSFFQSSHNGLTAEFSDGDIVDTKFKQCRNDGVNITGGVVLLKGVVADGAGRNGLYAGRNSQTTVENSEIKNTDIALACKDASTLTVRYVQLYNNATGFYAFNKGTVYGPAKITAENVVVKNTVTPYVVENDSVIMLDGKKVVSN